jgi:hypothetical protein
MAESQRLALPDVHTGHALGNDVPDGSQQVVLAGGRQGSFEFEVCIEVIFNRALGRARDEDQLGCTGLDCFFDCVLDQRLVDDRQHLLRACLGRRQKTRASARNGKYGGSDFLGHGVLHNDKWPAS